MYYGNESNFNGDNGDDDYNNDDYNDDDYDKVKMLTRSKDGWATEKQRRAYLLQTDHQAYVRFSVTVLS